MELEQYFDVNFSLISASKKQGTFDADNMKIRKADHEYI